MRGEVLFEKMTGISDAYIAEAALVAPVGVAAPKKRPFASLSRALHSGLGVACICLIAVASLLMGTATVGRIAIPAPEGTPPLARFGFTYDLGGFDGIAIPGDTVYVDTTIVNRGLPFVYHGSSAGYHPDAHFVLQGNESVSMQCAFMETCDSGPHAVAMGEEGGGYGEITIPADAIPGVYDLVLSYKGTVQVYKGVLTVEESTEDPSARFEFDYTMQDAEGNVHDGFVRPGEFFSVLTTVTNKGKSFRCVEWEYFANACFVLHGDETVRIAGDYAIPDSATPLIKTVENGESGLQRIMFTLPQNTVPGVYDLVLSYDGEKQVFGGALTVGDPNAKFSFGYKSTGDALTGATYLMNTWITNEGESFTFEGSSMGFAPTAVLIHMETQYRIDGSFGMDDDQGIFTVNTGDMRYVTQEFFIPADAPTGAYALKLSYGGVSESFPGAVIVTHLVLDYPLLENGHPFSFGYQPFGNIAGPGEQFIMNAWVINEGAPFSFMGDPYSFQPTATLYHMGSDYTIGGLPPPTGVEPRPCNILTGQQGESAYTFPIPADAPTGTYGLKLTYGGAQETFDNVLTVAEPTVIDPAVLYNLTMPIGSDWLYEPIDEAYVDGEEVTVRIKFATDVGTLFFLNGEVINAVTGDDQLGYWEYSFIMPQKDSEIIFHTYDGTAPYSGMLEAYYTANPEAEDVRIYDYGTFGDGVRVAIIDDARFMYTQLEEEHRIGPAIIRYSDGCFMQVLYNGVFCSLADAYGSGLLSDADMAALENLRRERAPYLYADSD